MNIDQLDQVAHALVGGILDRWS